MARADDPIKFQEMYKTHLKLENKRANNIGMWKTGFADELQPINPLDKNIPHDNFNGVVIKPTQETLDFMKGKYQYGYYESDSIDNNKKLIKKK